MTHAPTLEAQFSDLTDPRSGANVRHKFIDIVVIAILATLANADGWSDMAEFGKAKEAWLRQYLELPNGIPSHDTFRRLFILLDPQAFQQCFMNWVNAIHALTKGQVVAFDGKCLRGTQDSHAGKPAIYMVSAWAAADHMVLGQRKVDEKSNEITVIPELLALLDVTGCIVSVDALNCQKKTARQIVKQGGDYLLAVKDNQRHMREDVQNLFAWAADGKFAEMVHDQHTTIGKGHGRVETRTCTTISDPECLAMLGHLEAWENLRTVVQVHAKRQIGDAISEEERYYLSSLPADLPDLAARALEASRHHWGIENELHWVLDMTFGEDYSRTRTGNGAENLAVLRHFALNLIRREKSSGLSVRARRLKASWDDHYLLKLLSF
jgi:predicted transposase YbfD/YdcC